MKLTYWYSQCPYDSDVYSVRTRTRKEALAQIAELNRIPGIRTPIYHEPVKVTVQYRDAFDLMEECSNEGHHHWEAK